MSLFFLIRGIVQVVNIEISSAIDATISGFAGIGHILLGISIVLIMNTIRKCIK